MPEAPPCSEADLTPLLLCGAAACFDPGTPSACIIQQCAADYEQLEARCRSCADGLAEPAAAVWMDRVVTECTR